MRPVFEYIIWKGRYMKIKKKLNNNVAVVTDKTGNEIIVMGKGITYDKTVIVLLNEQRNI